MQSVRQLDLDDLDRLSKLFNDYRVWYRMPSDLQGSRKFLSERISAADSVIFGAFSDDLLVGFTQLYPQFSSVRLSRMWLLNDLFVAEDFRSKGFSKMLISRAKQHCLDTGALILNLETEKSNVIGNNLYPATGFKLIDDHNFYFWPVN
ncbi:MAG: GNAT family N-acetyltransferase [Saprospiraceae bacterium]|nr:GNAT family N-acetyltransferase [Saprospiraceae bacterium]